ncbi:site-specific DNA-methyltransferase [Methanobrevibacter sp. AbM4]|uniref:site-specific DNA-methyltransferase n=1 Tax=Methanobrevibacter sp. AbM4 TaxID=224719 RepID=UPI0003348F86|nr:site-specific DNA-methyltransferase [Methanobrevibacter sp. AbM4]AGN16019.1 type II DNA modification methylase [Methanobrevibacter sp. AbM4]
MFLDYPNKKSMNEILNKKYNGNFKIIKGENEKNKLFYGDNFDGLNILLHKYNLKGKIDLIYIDPPFSTNNIFKIGSRKNAISSSNDDEIAYEDTLKDEDYLEFIRERLILLYELLSKEGSIYFHIDYKIGHYIKILMDEIFGIENFRGDISRIKCNPKNFRRKGYGNIKDMILFYSKSNKYTWNYPTVPFTEKDIEKLYKKVDEKGRRYTTVPIHAPGETNNGDTGKKWRGMFPPKGRHWRCSLEKLDELDANGLIEWSKNGNPRKKNYAFEMKHKGKPMQDIWEDFKDPTKPEYPTEKNKDMLKKIIKTSSNEGDLILDCFMGSGTTIIAAQELGRKWIGMDKSPKAIEVSQKRLKKVQENLYSSGKYEYIKIE